MKLCIIGFGAVGKGVSKVVSMKKKMLIETKEKTGKISDYPEYGISNIPSVQVLDDIDYDCLIEVSPTNIDDGEPARTHMLKAMQDGKDVVTSNKGPLSLNFGELTSAADSTNAQFKYEASVGGAMPIINFAHETLAGNNITSVLGILNGTCNYILSRMANEGSPYLQTLNEAQELGIAETDPTQDVEGIDAACKIVILANSVLNMDVSLKDVKVVGISKITPESIALAKKEGLLIKLIGVASHDNLEVSPRLVREGSPFAVDGTLNVATLRTDLADDVTVVGKGAGSIETASAILSDIISIWKART
jgi:homoserine dehydrogenase